MTYRADKVFVQDIPWKGSLMQLEVVKTDGSVEEYLHTKVLGTFSNALVLTGESNLFAAEQFAEAVTFYLYSKEGENVISSEQIHLMVQAVLDSTGHQDAAAALGNHRMGRKLKRGRIEVVADGDEQEELSYSACQWDKSRVVRDLITSDGLTRDIARAIASSVEEKVLNLGMMRVRSSLIEQLVLADAEAMAKAKELLEPAVV